MSAKKLLDNRLRVRNKLNGVRTWIEIDTRALRHNYDIFRKLIGPKVKLWSVVKSNAYGHGIFVFSPLVDRIGVDGFCVDSVVEGLRLRREGIKKSILVFGPSLPHMLKDAALKNIEVTIAHEGALRELASLSNPPRFHLKIDTGMHRQGFFVENLGKVIRLLDRNRLREKMAGIYTHFASAKDVNYPSYTERQNKNFKEALRLLERAGCKNVVRHASATGGTLLGPTYHFDAVRIGIGMYGLYPSKELEMQLPKVRLRPVLRWRTRIAEIKKLLPGDYVGYDLVERMWRPTKVAVLPVGYWQGLPRVLSGTGEVLVNGKRARIVGRISMDLTVVDVTGIPCAVGDQVTLIGKDGGDELSAFDVAARAGTIHYELLTRLNPLIERVVM